MRTYFAVDESSCPTIQGKQPGNWQRHDDSKKTPTLFGWTVLIAMALLLLIPTAAVSKGGNGNGGGDPIVVIDPVVDYGDVFGDLMHILRYEYYDVGLDEYVPTGQPIFAQRWVEMPAELPGYGWGYCAIGVDEFDAEIAFLPYSCDLDVGDDPELSPVVEVDYFGRLNASRVQERNMRMHFNETITNIKQAGQLRLDPTGRLELGFESELNTGDPLCFVVCVVNESGEECVNGPEGQCLWSTIDSPMENLALYRRMMKYGHLSTDPMENDLWWHGDPAIDPLEIVHPALDKADFRKFDAAGLGSMLPAMYLDCYDGDNYAASCASPEYLTPEDFNTNAVFLGASAGKHGIITDHLVQYLNRFLRITQDTLFAASTKATLPAMYRDCYDGDDPWKEGEEAPEDYPLGDDLLYGDCEILEVVPSGEGIVDSTPNYDKFPNIQELFVNFGVSAYVRNSVWSDATAKLALESTSGLFAVSWDYDPSVSLLDWIKIPNPDVPAVTNIDNFVDSASDALRAIEFTHNYEVPENLYCTYALGHVDYCPVE